MYLRVSWLFFLICRLGTFSSHALCLPAGSETPAHVCPTLKETKTPWFSHPKTPVEVMQSVVTASSLPPSSRATLPPASPPADSPKSRTTLR